jgi:hypothetical protein
LAGRGGSRHRKSSIWRRGLDLKLRKAVTRRED